MANDKTRRLNTNTLPKRQTAITGPRRVFKVGRNEPCPCGSGEKYKDCHAGEGEAFLHKLAIDQEREKLKAKRAQMKADGVPWYRRIFS